MLILGEKKFLVFDSNKRTLFTDPLGELHSVSSHTYCSLESSIFLQMVTCSLFDVHCMHLIFSHVNGSRFLTFITNYGQLKKIYIEQYSMETKNEIELSYEFNRLSTLSLSLTNNRFKET